MGAEATELLLVTNPLAILAGKPAWGCASTAVEFRRKNWFAFWR
jgi:hypothetical protein